MSASTYLSCREMCRIFPSITEVVFQSGGWDPRNYGLMQKCNGTTYFGQKSGEGKLQMSLQAIFDMAKSMFGKYDPRTIIVFWVVDVKNNDVFLELYQVENSRSEKRAVEMFPSFRLPANKNIPVMH